MHRVLFTFFVVRAGWHPFSCFSSPERATDSVIFSALSWNIPGCLQPRAGRGAHTQEGAISPSPYIPPLAPAHACLFLERCLMRPKLLFLLLNHLGDKLMQHIPHGVGQGTPSLRAFLAHSFQPLRASVLSEACRESKNTVGQA